MKTLPLLLSLCLLLPACASFQGNPHPELLLSLPRPAAKSVVVSTLLDYGYLVIADSDYSLTVESKASAGEDFFFTNLRTGDTPRRRIRISFAETPQGTRAIASILFVHAPAFAGRTSEEEYTNPRAYEHLQAILGAIDAKAKQPPRQ